MLKSRPNWRVIIELHKGARGGSSGFKPGDLAELALEGRRDRGSHDVRAGAGITKVCTELWGSQPAARQRWPIAGRATQPRAGYATIKRVVATGRRMNGRERDSSRGPCGWPFDWASRAAGNLARRTEGRRCCDCAIRAGSGVLGVILVPSCSLSRPSTDHEVAGIQPGATSRHCRRWSARWSRFESSRCCLVSARD